MSVAFSEVGVVVGLRRRARQLRCPCGFTTKSRYDTSRRRWRHLDAGACQVWLEAEIHRVDCPNCGVRTEEVPWARPGARHSRDFQDVVAWLCQRMDKTSVGRLMRCSWEAVDRIVADVVDDYLDESRFDDLYRIGVDEIAYRRGHQYLTIVADHDSGRVVWVAKDRSKQALTSFYDALGDERRAHIEAVSMDMSKIYREATREAVPHAAICFDPFHLMQWVNRALDAVLQRDSQRRAGDHLDQTVATDPHRAAHRGRTTRRRATSTRPPAASPTLRTVPCLGTQRTVPRSVPHDRPDQRPGLSQRLDPPRLHEQDPPIRQPRPPRPRQPHRHHRHRPARSVKQPPRRHQRQDPTDQQPGPRPPLTQRPPQLHLPLPRRNHHHTAHTKVRRGTHVRSLAQGCHGQWWRATPSQ